MARKGRRHSGKRLEPPLPEVKAELYLPKYFGVIKGGGYNKAEERREVVPGPMPRSDETPRAISGRRSLKQPAPYPSPAPEPEGVPLLVRATRYIGRQNKAKEDVPGPLPRMDEAPKAIRGRQPLLQPAPYPGPAPEPERVPLVLRAARYIGSILGVEPERPVPMPVVPELNFPALYTRFPVMKTVTKTTDAAGEISVTYAQSYATIPGVVITVKDPDNVFGTVFSTTLTGFDVRLFKMDHDHGGTVDDGGKHTPTINADGGHSHNVQGTGNLSLDTNYGRLVIANYTDYEKDHVHKQTFYNTWYEKDHVHTNPATSANNRGHVHGLPDWTGVADEDTELVANGWQEGTACVSGHCITSLDGIYVPSTTHYNALGGDTDGESQNHTHTQGNTGGVDHMWGHRHGLNDTGADANPLGHRHLISDDLLYKHYVYDVGLTLDLVATANEDPLHAHSGEEIAVHKHDVPADGRVLLKNTSITLTYIAQEESS